MIKKVIYIGNPSYLSCKNEQLQIKNPDTGEISSVPICDIGYLELDNPQITITNYCLSTLMDNNTIVVVCNNTHIPNGTCLATTGNHLQSKRIQSQLDCPLPLKKNLWKQIITFKILNQQSLLESYYLQENTLSNLVKQVKSGDTSNIEGQASQHYWKNVFPDIKFKRDRFGEYPNNLLNYGYMVLRAITARAIVSSGLHPSIGIHHKNQYNPYCLADDLMEPFRPIVDMIVLQYYICNQRVDDLGKVEKAYLLKLAFMDVELESKTSPLMIAVSKLCSQITEVYMGESKTVSHPKLCFQD